MTSSQHLYIESDANPRLKRWRRLALEAKAVRREGATVLEGIHLLQTVLEHPEVKINAVMLPEGRTTAEAKALAERAAQTAGTRLYVLSDRLYDAISPVENGVGVMCEIALPAAPVPEKWAAADALYLDGVQDAGNVGTLRACRWLSRVRGPLVCGRRGCCAQGWEHTLRWIWPKAFR